MGTMGTGLKMMIQAKKDFSKKTRMFSGCTMKIRLCSSAGSSRAVECVEMVLGKAKEKDVDAKVEAKASNLSDVEKAKVSTQM